MLAITYNTFFGWKGTSWWRSALAPYLFYLFHSFFQNHTSFARATIELALHNNPDFLCLNEILVTQDDIIALPGLLRNRGYQVILQRGTPRQIGTIVASTFAGYEVPFSLAHDGKNRGSAAYHVPELQLTVAGFHLDTRSNVREKQLAFVLEFGMQEKQKGNRLLFTGDFNDTLSGSALVENLSLQDCTGKTFPNNILRYWPFRLHPLLAGGRPDHILVDSEFTIQSCGVVSGTSDHNLLWVEFT